MSLGPVLNMLSPRQAMNVGFELQPRLDWQLWFAAMSSIDRERWLIALIVKLLDGEPTIRTLFARDPSTDRPPPKFVRILRYRYRFAPLSAAESWTRDGAETYLPPLSRAMFRARN